MSKAKQFKNGVTFITVPVKGTRATTVLVMFPIGSRYETAKLSGASHFLEHMLFKGTVKRPTALDISLTIEKYGASYNAFTSKEYTGYYIKIDGSKQGVAFDLLSDMILNSTLDAAEIEKEKGAIVEELRMYQDNPSMAIDLLFDRLFFGDHPLGWDIGGTEDSVRGITRDELFEYYRRHYGPTNMLVIVAGDIDQRRLPQFVKEFGAAPVVKGATKPVWYQKKYTPTGDLTAAAPFKDRVAVEQKQVDQAQVMLGFPAFSHRDPRRYAASLLAVILGGGMSSRLFVEVREKRGLAYVVRAATASFRDSGQFYIQAGLDPSRLPEALVVIQDELRKVAKELVTPNELAFAKSSVAGHLALSLEDSRSQAQWYGDQYLFMKKIETPAQYVKALNRVTLRDITQVANQIFDFNVMRAAAIGNFTKDQFLTYW